MNELLLLLLLLFIYLFITPTGRITHVHKSTMQVYRHTRNTLKHIKHAIRREINKYIFYKV